MVTWTYSGQTVHIRDPGLKEDRPNPAHPNFRFRTLNLTSRFNLTFYEVQNLFMSKTIIHGLNIIAGTSKNIS